MCMFIVIEDYYHIFVHSEDGKWMVQNDWIVVPVHLF